MSDPSIQSKSQRFLLGAKGKEQNCTGIASPVH